MSRIYSLQYQAMKKDIDKYFEENKEEVNKSFLNRGCRITVKVDRLECYHSNSIPMNWETSVTDTMSRRVSCLARRALAAYTEGLLGIT